MHGSNLSAEMVVLGIIANVVLYKYYIIWMSIFKSVHVKEENWRFYIITQWAYIIGFVGHILACLRFELIDLVEMMRVNLFYSIPCFALAFIINRRGKHDTAFLLAFIELLVHQILSTYYLGWNFGAHYWLIYLAGLSFFNPAWQTRVQIGMLLIVLACYVYIYFNFYNGVYQVDEELFFSSTLSSALVTITIICLLINYYSKAAKKAEQRLTEEKEKTAIMLDKVESLFGQQVSEEIAQELITSDFDLGSKQFDASILFLDIRDFTVFADSHEPQEVAKFQNAVFSELINSVKKNNGVVLQILGDGIMAVFGAPSSDPYHSDHAVSAGYSMIAKVQELIKGDIIPFIKVGIGVNSGKIIAGNVGNESRRFYSLTGKNVIIAARLEQLNKQFESQFLISEYTYDKLTEKPEATDLGKLDLKGIEESVRVFKLK